MVHITCRAQLALKRFNLNVDFSRAVNLNDNVPNGFMSRRRSFLKVQTDAVNALSRLAQPINAVEIPQCNFRYAISVFINIRSVQLEHAVSRLSRVPDFNKRNRFAAAQRLKNRIHRQGALHSDRSEHNVQL